MKLFDYLQGFIFGTDNFTLEGHKYQPCRCTTSLIYREPNEQEKMVAMEAIFQIWGDGRALEESLEKEEVQEEEGMASS